MASRSLTFEAALDNRDGELRPGLFAEAEITIDPEAKAIAIAAGSLIEFAGAQKVWKVVDGTAKEQPVRPGRRTKDVVEIVDGLKPGDEILVDGSIGRVAKVIPPDAKDRALAQAQSSAPAATDEGEKAIPAESRTESTVDNKPIVPAPADQPASNSDPASSQPAG